jgi:hypothetical protein
MVADLLAFLEDVEGAGKSVAARTGEAAGGVAPTVRMEARAIRSMLLKMTD